ncbi:unnamed protein product [Rhizoctonia solani]|uniref:Transmembrane protein n=1 Tax=Rhizoctonia solani TaxID=456999 RepID=A0A8H3DHT7_9AGAM|nr:unnamed protein product [Rhizoctonia solani]
MIVDAESPPKSPASSSPTVRQTSEPSFARPVSYATFPNVRHSAQYTTINNEANSETRPLLYQPSPESIYHDADPPSYDEINPLPKVSATRKRFWIRCAAAVLAIFIFGIILHTRDINNIRRPIRTPGAPSPPKATDGPVAPLPTPNNPAPSLPPSLPVPLPPLPPVADLPDPRTVPFILPTKGRIDLCRPWAYSSKPGVSPSVSDNRPMDKLVYNIPTQAPIHMETAAVCLTRNGTSEFCEQYDDSYDSMAGKLQVIGAEIEHPQIDITIQHGSETGLDSTSVCLFNRPDENGKHRWVVGIYTWKDPTTPDRDALLVSMSIVVTLPRTQVHSFSTRLGYFTQVIGPEIKTDSNALIFDTLQAHLGARSSLAIRNVTAAVIHTSAIEDTQLVKEVRLTKSIQMRSDSGLIECLVTLVQTDLPEVRMDIRSAIGAVSAIARLEYLSHLSRPPRYNIATYSKFSPAMVFVDDPQGTSLLCHNPNVIPVFPIIRVNATSHLSIAQAVVPATFYGNLGLASKHAAIVAIDHAKDIPGRAVSYQPTSMGYKGSVQWAGRTNKLEEAGSISATTEYASARLLFLGLDDDGITDWPEDGDVVLSGQ